MSSTAKGRMPNILASYEHFLLNNASTIQTFESSLRSLTWFLPGRFKDAELASEALTSSLNLMGFCHDALLTRMARADPKYRPILPPSNHSRYTRAWSDKSAHYKWAARALEMVRFIELVVEMGLRRTASKKNKWRGIVLLELIKAILRLIILKTTRRPSLTSPLPVRDIDVGSLDIQPHPPSDSSRSDSPLRTPEHLKNNHISVNQSSSLLNKPEALSCETPIEEYLLPNALSTDAVKGPLTLLRELESPTDWMAEVIFILRPLIYVALLSRHPKGTNPLLISLSLELLSRYLRRAPSPKSSLERSEYARRDRDLLWYLLRGSIWETYTKPKLESVAIMTSRSSILGIVGVVIKNWIPLIEDYYYYTST